MKRSEAKAAAKEILMEALSVVYYRLEDKDYTEEEKKDITDCINRLGARMAKAIGEEYYTQ